MIAYKKKIKSKRIGFSIKADSEKYEFYCADGGDMNLVASASTRFLTCEIAGKCFTGTVMGIYAQSNKPTLSSASFYKFEIK